MDTEKLKELIGKAIKAGFKLPKVEPGTAPQIAQYLMRQVSTEETIQEEILHYFNSEPTLEIFKDKMFKTGGGSWYRVTHEMLLQWLLYTTSIQGIDKAISNLATYLKLDHTPATEILAVSGVDVESSISLTPSITLLPFSKVPSSSLKDAHDPEILMKHLAHYYPSPYPMLDAAKRLPSAAIVRGVSLSPKSVDPSADICDYFQESLDLYEACEILTLIGKCTPLPIAHWYTLEEWVPCRDYVFPGSSLPIHDVINPSKCTISSGHALEVRTLCERFFKLTSEVRAKLRVPIQRLNQARRRQNVADKAIDLGVSFESLYLGDRSPKEQISFTFRLRGAWHLGKDKLERQSLIDVFNKIYECRSTAVHTGKLDFKIKVKGRGQVETIKFLEEADDLCVRSITKIINSGEFPDWDQIILGTD